jgi:hypothetical protein
VSSIVTTRLIRAAFGRGALLGATLALTAAVVLLLAQLIVPNAVRGDLWVILGLVFCFGFVATPLELVERIAARYGPSIRRDTTAAAVSGLLSSVAALVIIFQAIYFARVYRSGFSLAATQEAFEEIGQEIAWTMRYPGNLVRLLVLTGIPACPPVVGRLRGWRLGPQIGFVAGITFVANAVVVIAMDGSEGEWATVAAITAGVASLTPVLFRWADAAEVLWARALGREPEETGRPEGAPR